MPGSLFNFLGNGIGNRNVNQNYQRNNSGNIISQLAQVKKDPGAILDILLMNGKIDQAQYNDLQQYRNNPEMIGQYLINHGKANEIGYAEQQANHQLNNGNYK